MGDKPVAGAHVVFHRKLKVPRKGKTPERIVRMVLLCKRTQDAPNDAGCWSLFGGKIDGNEEPANAAKREVLEELHLHLEAHDLEKLCDVPAKHEPGSFVAYYSFRLNWDLDNLTLRRNPQGKVEGEGLGWFTEEEVRGLKIRPDDQKALNEFFTTHRG
jgi:ADP-ribose pyrophosphatase YjhB (NUDIX family)